MTNFDQQTVIDALKSRGLPKPCSECGRNDWDLVPGFINVGHGPQPSGGVYVAGAMFPTVGLVCSTCGYVKTYAAARLGLV